MEKIPEQFKCPICFEVLVSEIYQCKNGHIICPECSANQKECPQCRVSFENPKIRNRALEALLDSDSLKIACPYKNDGCKKILKIKEFCNHSLICVHNPKCINFCALLGYDTCNYVFNISRVIPALRHFKAKHDFIGHDGWEVAIQVENFRRTATSTSQDVNFLWTPIVMKCRPPMSTQFITNCLILTRLNTEDNTLSFLCILLGQNVHWDDEVAKDYVAHLLIINQSQEMDHLEWTIPSVDILKSKPLLKHFPIRISTSLLLQHYTNESSGSLLVNVKIEKISSRRKELTGRVRKTLNDLEVIHVTTSVSENSSANIAEDLPKSETDHHHHHHQVKESTPSETCNHYKNSPEPEKPAARQARSFSPIRLDSENVTAFMYPTGCAPSPSFMMDIDQNHKFVKRCNQCNISFVAAIHFKCLQCPNFILCPVCCCISHHHDQHILAQLSIQFEHDILLEVAEIEQGSGTRKPLFADDCEIPFGLMNMSKDSQMEFSCDGVPKDRGAKKGNRCGNLLVTFVCLQCRNYQLCMPCIQEMAIGMDHQVPHIMAIVHNMEQLYRVKRHIFNKFPIFKSMNESQSGNV